MNEAEARGYMERAIEEMKNSIAEPRNDGKVSPAVGAVVVLPNGDVELAHRKRARERRGRDREEQRGSRQVGGDSHSRRPGAPVRPVQHVPQHRSRR